MSRAELGVPSHFVAERVGEVWRVPYQERAAEASQWARRHDISPAASDDYRISLIAVDVQNTFCIPGFELYVGGRSGSGAVDDNRRLCEFIYRNLDVITQICPTLDTHRAMQIFHNLFLVNDAGEHPAPYTVVEVEDLERGVWRFNEALGNDLGVAPEYGQAYLLHYARTLRDGGKYALTIWPFHAMLGGIGHALVSSVEEAIFFHGIARTTEPDFQQKGDNPFTENYSVLRPEVCVDGDGHQIAIKNADFIARLLDFDAVVIAGQAKSHCVAWTIDDLLSEIAAANPALARKVYLLEDCTSAVVVPGVVDYTEQADAAFRRFADAGMHVVRTTEPISSWPGLAR